MADVDVRGLVLADLVALAATREDCGADLAVVAAEVDREKAQAKGARTTKLRLLEAAMIHLNRAGVHVPVATGVRLASHCLTLAAETVVEVPGE